MQPLNPAPHRFGYRRSINADVDAARMAEIEERAHAACVELLPGLYELDDFGASLVAELPEIGAGR